MKDFVKNKRLFITIKFDKTRMRSRKYKALLENGLFKN